MGRRYAGDGRSTNGERDGSLPTGLAVATACLVVSAATLGVLAGEDGVDVGALLDGVPVGRLLCGYLLTSSLVFGGAFVHRPDALRDDVPRGDATSELSLLEVTSGEDPSRPLDRRLGIELSGYDAPARPALPSLWVHVAHR